MSLSSLHRTAVVIELIEPVVVSARSASTGGHQSLSVIPGGTLLGLAAQRLYDELDGATAWRVFHSGAVRFGDGLPILNDGAVGAPIPASLAVPKGARAEIDGQLNHSTVINLAHPGAGATGVQFEPIRGRFITDDLRLFSVRRTDALKTAIDRQTGRARDAMLFELEAIDADQSFLSTIDADADKIDKAEFERVVASLLATGRARIGRSRSAEYGQVRLTRIDSLDPVTSNDAKDHVVWLKSDLCVEGLDGRHNCLAFRAGSVQGWRIVPERSFVTWRTYAPFNGRWAVHAPERVVAAAGSVLTFEKSDPRAAPLSKVLSAASVGREAGLGAIAIDAPLLNSSRPVATDVQRLAIPRSREYALSKEPPGPVGAWLVASAGQSERQDDIAALLPRLLKDLGTAYQKAARLAGLSSDETVGPGLSQWSQVADIARNRADKSSIKQALFEKNGPDPLIKLDDKDWGRTIRPRVTFRSWLEEAIDDYFDDQNTPIGLTLLAEAAASELKRNPTGW